jgi:hypothetical protein
MNIDPYIISKDQEVRLGLGRTAFFIVTQADHPTFDTSRLRRITLGPCKRAVISGLSGGLDVDLIDAVDGDAIIRKIKFLCSTEDSMGLVIERVKGKTCLVALLVTTKAFDEATAAFAEIDEDDDEEEVQAYMARDRETGEEYIMVDQPGGTFRDLGDEYVKSEDTGLKLRDRRNGYWKNGDCVNFRPEGEVRQALLDVSFSGSPRIIKVPTLDRTQIFPDGYEVIEENSVEGWLVWEWCAANAKGDWEWVNLGTDGGPWLSFGSMLDHVAFAAAFPDLCTGGDT